MMTSDTSIPLGEENGGEELGDSSHSSTTSFNAEVELEKLRSEINSLKTHVQTLPHGWKLLLSSVSVILAVVGGTGFLFHDNMAKRLENQKLQLLLNLPLKPEVEAADEVMLSSIEKLTGEVAVLSRNDLNNTVRLEQIKELLENSNERDVVTASALANYSVHVSKYSQNVGVAIDTFANFASRISKIDSFDVSDDGKDLWEPEEVRETINVLTALANQAKDTPIPILVNSPSNDGVLGVVTPAASYRSIYSR